MSDVHVGVVAREAHPERRADAPRRHDQPEEADIVDAEKAKIIRQLQMLGYME